MKHTMKLHRGPYHLIKSGIKTIELRLYDEKRRAIAIGDEIEFVHSVDPTLSLSCTVIALHVFSYFEELYNNLPLLKCGYTVQDISTASPHDMDAYYSKEKQMAYDVIRIEIRLNQ